VLLLAEFDFGDETTEKETDAPYGTYWGKEKYIQNLMGKPESKRLLQRPGLKW